MKHERCVQAPATGAQQARLSFLEFAKRPTRTLGRAGIPNPAL